jgi:2-keto-myo-inositol isomerase
MVAPRLNHVAFFDLTRRLGVDTVEIRNDLAGVALLDGSPAAKVGEAAKARALHVASINALQRFNRWDEQRAGEAATLISACAASGAKALVLCPVNDVNWTPSPAERQAELRKALSGLGPLLAAANVLGFVEPLGFVECSLRLKEEAVEAIEAIGGARQFKLVHDTFHHFVAGEKKLFPQHTGLVHISGVDDPAATAATMRDPHRVLVDAKDRIGNLEQLSALRAGGYRGLISFEPFAASVHASTTIEKDLRASLDFVAAGLK